MFDRRGAPREELYAVPDCDCDAMDEIAHHPIKVERYATNELAARRFQMLLDAGKVSLVAVHGPSGHVLNVRVLDGS